MTNVLVAKALGPEGKGVLLLLSGMLGVLLSLFSLGLPTAAAYFARNAGLTLGQVVGASLLVSASSTAIAAGLFMIFLQDIVRIFLGSARDVTVHPYWIWMTLACLFPAMISGIGDLVLIVKDEMKLYVVKRTGSALVHLLLTWILVVVLFLGVTGELWAELVSLVIDAGVLVYWLTRKRIWTTVRISLESLRDMLRVGLQQYGVSLVALVAKRFDTFLVGAVLSVREAGYFSIPYLLYSQAMVVPQSAMWPTVSKLTGSPHEDNARQLAATTRIQIALMGMLAILIGATAPWWIRALFGEAFLPSIGAVLLILPTLVVAPITVSGNALLTSRGQPGKVMLPSILATLSQVVVGLILVPRIGISGSSIALTTNYIIVAAWMAAWIVRQGSLGYRSLLLPTTNDVERILGYVSKQIRRVWRQLAWRDPADVD